MSNIAAYDYAMSDRNALATHAVKRLLEIEQASTMKPHEFWKALIRLAQNEALLRTALLRGDFQIGIADPTKAQKPIET